MAKIAIDSNVIIYFYGSLGELQDQATTLITAGNSGSELIISELLFLELLSKSSFSSAEAAELYDQSKRLPINKAPVDISVLLQAAELRRKHPSLKTPDAIHLATAIKHGCEYFVTNDDKLLKLKLPGIKITSSRDINRLTP